MRNVLPLHATVLIGLSLYPKSTADLKRPAIVDVKPPALDVRVAKLEAFFKSYHCPRPLYISEYLGAADRYKIDYRLLPALSVRESTCGLHHLRNNHWGWDFARTGFESVPSGIDFVARQLAKGRYYRGKTVDEKLHAYNPNPQYAREVKQLMLEIDS
jgi:hypothetical protein